MVFSLIFLETSQYSFGLRLEEVTLCIHLDGEHPSSGNIIFRSDLPHVNEFKKTSVSTTGLYSS